VIFVALLSPLILITSSIVRNFLSIFLEPLSSSVGTSKIVPKDSTIDVYIPGAGFSGFFYTLGRLHALHSSPHHNSSAFQYYCFSAGCLALLTSLMQVPVNSAVELAHFSRNRWITGEIGRYDVVEHFVDNLFLFGMEDSKYVSLDAKGNTTIYRVGAECHSNQESVVESAQFTSNRVGTDIRHYLPRINVITSTWDARHFISHRIQKPLSAEHFKELLIQTTWIPFVTGSSFWKTEGGVYHNDGAFAGLLQSFNPSLSKREKFCHPRQYHHSLLLPWSFDLLTNGLNILLGHDRGGFPAARRYQERV
jgi:hypothetical protein